jgi:hypothetical protein
MLSASSSSSRPGERVADAEDQLDRFGRLDRPDDPRAGTPEHSAFGAARHEPGGGGSGIEQR